MVSLDSYYNAVLLLVPRFGIHQNFPSAKLDNPPSSLRCLVYSAVIVKKRYLLDSQTMVQCLQDLHEDQRKERKGERTQYMILKWSGGQSTVESVILQFRGFVYVSPSLIPNRESN